MATARSQHQQDGQRETQRPSSASRADSENNLVQEGAGCSSSGNNNNNTNQRSPTMLTRWPLAKYACFIIDSQAGTNNNTDQQTTGGGSTTMTNRWLERAAQQHNPPDMWIQVTQRHLIQILHGDVLVECCNLSDARREWRALRRGHDMLFNIVTNNVQKRCRKFRIRFLPSGSMDAVAVAQSCQNHLSPYLTFLDLRCGQQQPTSQDPQLPCVDFKQLAQSILDPHHSKWPRRYLELGCHSSTPMEEDQLSAIVQSCLLDPAFPDFVEAVEKSLKALISAEDPS